MQAIAEVWHLAPIATKLMVLAPSGGSKKFHKRNFCGGLDNDMGMGMDIAAERKCPCPLWGQVLASG